MCWEFFSPSHWKNMWEKSYQSIFFPPILLQENLYQLCSHVDIVQATYLQAEHLFSEDYVQANLQENLNGVYSVEPNTF